MRQFPTLVPISLLHALCKDSEIWNNNYSIDSKEKQASQQVNLQWNPEVMAIVGFLMVLKKVIFKLQVLQVPWNIMA